MLMYPGGVAEPGLGLDMYTYTKGASPRRADARVGSAHACNYRGCGQIETANVIQYCQGVHQKQFAFE